MCELSWGLSTLAAAAAVFSWVCTGVFIKLSRGYREESRAQISRMGTSIVQLAEENSELRNMNSALREQLAQALTTIADFQRLPR